VDILKNNWEGNELLRQRVKRTFPKYGMGDSETDSFARISLERLADKINGRPNSKGGVYRFGAFTVDWRFAFGEKTAASADGRLAGETISKNLCATLGCDREGVTAHIASAAKLGGTITPNGSVVAISFHSSAVGGENGMLAMMSSLKAFVEAGGTAIQYNVLNAETLRDAYALVHHLPDLASQIKTDAEIEAQYKEHAQAVEASPGYLAALEELGVATTNRAQKFRELDSARKAKDATVIERIQKELDQFTKDLENAQSKLNLEILKYPAHETNEKLISEDWCRDAQNALKENCNLERLVAMDREALGNLINEGTKFVDAFPAAKAAPVEPELNVPVAARVSQGLVVN
jgi:hypothetical protein